MTVPYYSNRNEGVALRVEKHQAAEAAATDSHLVVGIWDHPLASATHSSCSSFSSFCRSSLVGGRKKQRHAATWPTFYGLNAPLSTSVEQFPIRTIPMGYRHPPASCPVPQLGSQSVRHYTAHNEHSGGGISPS